MKIVLCLINYTEQELVLIYSYDHSGQYRRIITTYLNAFTTRQYQSMQQKFNVFYNPVFLDH